MARIEETHAHALSLRQRYEGSTKDGPWKVVSDADGHVDLVPEQRRLDRTDLLRQRDDPHELDDVTREMDINQSWPVRMIQKFLPQLKKATVTVVEPAPPAVETPLFGDPERAEEAKAQTGMDAAALARIATAKIAAGELEVRPAQRTCDHERRRTHSRVQPARNDGEGRAASACNSVVTRD